MNYRINVFNVKDSDSNVKAYANVAFGESFVVRNIAIVEKRDGEGLFVAMPSYRSNEVDQDGQHVYKSVANPITKEFQQELSGAILEAYENRENLGKDGMKMGDGIGEPKFNISVNVFEKEGSNIRGLARMYIEDAFVVQNISIVEGKNGLFVSMPAYKTGKGDYQDIAFPISKEFREKLYSSILDTYKAEKEKPRDERAAEAKDNAQAKNDEFLEVSDKDSLPFR
ncbi:MAG: SpoVG family protein [Clostridia bacterium]|nr:SpoVG family protein [Clostridia bacterium]